MCVSVYARVSACLRKCLATRWESREIGLETWKKGKLISEILNKQTNKQTQTTEGMSWKVLTEKTHIICFFFMGFLQEQKGLQRLDFSNRRSVNPEIVMLKSV